MSRLLTIAETAEALVPWSERVIELPPSRVYQPDRIGFVYFVRCQRCVKIGFTTEKAPDMPERMKMLQTGCPYPLYLIAKVPSSHRTEKKIHRKLDHLRLRGEWFDMLPEMKAFLDAVKAGAKLETLL